MPVITIPKILKADERHKEDVISFVEEKFERRLAEEIGKVRSEIIKWMFIFIFGQFWAIVGVLFVFFKK